MLVLVVVLATACQQTNTTAGDGAASTTAEVPSNSPTSSPSPPPGTTKVPKVEGKAADTAEAILVAAHLLVDTKTKYTDQIPDGTILSQTPSARAVVEVGTIVNLTIAKAFPVIPNVVGIKLSKAHQVLKSRGFDVRVKKQVSSQPKDTVVSQIPVGGTSARPGRTVTITVAKPAPAPPPPTNNCTAGYSPCLVYHGGADYDCAGGSGDGPYYTEPGVTYRVTGSDPYGLDADNDGYGCE